MASLFEGMPRIPSGAELDIQRAENTRQFTYNLMNAFLSKQKLQEEARQFNETVPLRNAQMSQMISAARANNAKTQLDAMVYQRKASELESAPAAMAFRSELESSGASVDDKRIAMYKYLAQNPNLIGSAFAAEWEKSYDDSEGQNYKAQLLELRKYATDTQTIAALSRIQSEIQMHGLTWEHKREMDEMNRKLRENSGPYRNVVEIDPYTGQPTVKIFTKTVEEAERYAEAARQKAEMDGGVFSKPTGGPQENRPKPTPTDKAFLLSHPELRSKYEARFGPGSASEVLK